MRWTLSNLQECPSPVVLWLCTTVFMGIFARIENLEEHGATQMCLLWRYPARFEVLPENTRGNSHSPSYIDELIVFSPGLRFSLTWILLLRIFFQTLTLFPFRSEFPGIISSVGLDSHKIKRAGEGVLLEAASAFSLANYQMPKT